MTLRVAADDADCADKSSHTPRRHQLDQVNLDADRLQEGDIAAIITE